jgi:hypothetical protein
MSYAIISRPTCRSPRATDRNCSAIKPIGALAGEGAAGAYRPGAGGGPGEIVLPTTPSRSAVIEELYHLGQHRRTGWSPHFAKTKTLYKAAEVDAQTKLLRIKTVAWTPLESSRFAEALKFWTTW